VTIGVLAVSAAPVIYRGMGYWLVEIVRRRRELGHEAGESDDDGWRYGQVKRRLFCHFERRLGRRGAGNADVSDFSGAPNVVLVRSKQECTQHFMFYVLLHVN
jgi:hypothetical protein